LPALATKGNLASILSLRGMKKSGNSNRRNCCRSRRRKRMMLISAEKSSRIRDSGLKAGSLLKKIRKYCYSPFSVMVSSCLRITNSSTAC